MTPWGHARLARIREIGQDSSGLATPLKTSRPSRFYTWIREIGKESPGFTPIRALRKPRAPSGFTPGFVISNRKIAVMLQRRPAAYFKAGFSERAGMMPKSANLENLPTCRIGRGGADS